MKLSFHINFNGKCAEAFQFYQNHLKGISGPLLTYRNSPASANVPDQYEIPMGFCLLIRLNSGDEVKALFDVFKQGGKVILPPQETFWSPCYAIVTDRFGIPWKFNCVA